MLSPDEKVQSSTSEAAASVSEQTPIAPDEKPAAGQALKREIRVWTRDLLIAIGLALVIIVFLYQPVKVEGTSMAPLLSDQERIFINKFVYRFEPIQRGDVVVFWYPLDHSKSFIKRVIGLPGETVEIRRSTKTSVILVRCACRRTAISSWATIVLVRTIHACSDPNH